MKERLDEADLKILRLLQEDGRITNADLARQVGLSPPSMLQRVRKLEDSGFIQQYTAKLHHENLGYNLMVIAMVSLALHQEKAIEQFVDSVKKIPEVLECLNVSGDCDFLLKIIAKDMPDYERIVREKLSRVKSIGKINSCFVLGINKTTTTIPL